MFTHLRLLATGLALLGLMACQPGKKADVPDVAVERASIHEAAALWINAYNARSADAIASVFSDDAWIIPPDSPAVIGQRAIRDFMNRVWTASKLQYVIGETDLEITSPATAWRAGRFEARNDAGAIVAKGSFIEIWGKLDGNWRMRRSIFNSESLPAAVAAAEEPAPAT